MREALNMCPKNEGKGIIKPLQRLVYVQYNLHYISSGSHDWLIFTVILDKNKLFPDLIYKETNLSPPVSSVFLLFAEAAKLAPRMCTEANCVREGDSTSLRASTHCLINTSEYLTSQDEGVVQRCQEAKYYVRVRLTAIASNDECGRLLH